MRNQDQKTKLTAMGDRAVVCPDLKRLQLRATHKTDEQLLSDFSMDGAIRRSWLRRPVMHGAARYLIVTLALLMMTGCSTTVSSENLYGTYIASYPFGTATLRLNRDGSFFQQVRIKGQTPATAKGSWSFDPIRSKITLHGAMAVVDGYGDLSKDWRTPDDLPDQPVERLWFRVAIETSVDYPYLKH